VAKECGEQTHLEKGGRKILKMKLVGLGSPRRGGGKEVSYNRNRPWSDLAR